MTKLGCILLCLLFSGDLFAQRKDTVIIKSIYFGGGSYDIDSEQILELYQLIESIPNLDDYQISITSHTDNIGGQRYNAWLSEMRSEAVIELLIFKKIPPDKIFKKDFGQNNPLYDNNTLNGRMLNRRVDIIFSPLLF